MDREALDRVGRRLQDAGQTLAVAESATGGLLSAHISTAYGAGSFFTHGVAAYSYRSKLRGLGVSRETLDNHGAVSEGVAGEMAAGVRDRVGATWGLATTGVAGPGGGTPDKPVGTVYVAVAYAGDWGSEQSIASVERKEFDGDRNELRKKFVGGAVDSLLAELSSS